MMRLHAREMLALHRRNASSAVVLLPTRHQDILDSPAAQSRRLLAGILGRALGPRDEPALRRMSAVFDDKSIGAVGSEKDKFKHELTKHKTDAEWQALVRSLSPCHSVYAYLDAAPGDEARRALERLAGEA